MAPLQEVFGSLASGMLHKLSMFGTISEVTMVESSCKQCELFVTTGEVSIEEGKASC